MRSSMHAIFDVHKLASCEAYEQISEWVQNMQREVASGFAPTEHQVKVCYCNGCGDKVVSTLLQALHSAQMLALSEFLSCACCFVRYGDNARLSLANEAFYSLAQVINKQLHRFQLAAQVFIWQRPASVGAFR